MTRPKIRCHLCHYAGKCSSEDDTHCINLYGGGQRVRQDKDGTKTETTTMTKTKRQRQRDKETKTKTKTRQTRPGPRPNKYNHQTKQGNPQDKENQIFSNGKSVFSVYLVQSYIHLPSTPTKFLVLVVLSVASLSLLKYAGRGNQKDSRASKRQGSQPNLLSWSSIFLITIWCFCFVLSLSSPGVV
jgi:hypothetical protein